MTVGVDFFPLQNSKCRRDIDEVLIPISDDHICSPRHAGVHGVLAEHDTERRIVGIGGQAADHIAGIDVFQGHRFFLLSEIIGDSFFQYQTDILAQNIAGCILSWSTVSLSQVATRTFSYYNDCMVFCIQPFFQRT